jgi:hypothetical protein
VTCGFTPYFLAFPEQYTFSIMIFDNTMNAFFFIEVCMNFFTVYYKEDFEVVEDLKVS